MRKALYGLLMFVMLTPALACAASMCAVMNEQQVQMSARDMPCHGEPQQNQEKSNFLMTFKDCAKVDLYGADHAALKAPDLKITKIFYGELFASVAYSAEPPVSYLIRGPPSIAATQGLAYPPVYLTTQRLRI